jgi:endonuclease YncB( thermonuclease family)
MTAGAIKTASRQAPVRATLRALVLAALPLLANAGPRTCLVVGVNDGDTLTARCGAAGSHERIKVRIAAIDAPEKNQPFGQRARQALSELCLRDMAKIYRRSTDRNGQTVADVECRNQDVARHMIAGGWAWVYDGATELGDAPLYKAQDVVRDARQGLWRDPAAVAPWKWRKQEGEARKRNSAPG